MSARNPHELYEKHQLLLNSRQIRVLDILPDPDLAPSPDGQMDIPIKASIRVVNLDDRPNFTALSYVCGTDAGESPTVLCDGVSIKIYRNGYSALWHLRRKLGRLTIWVDCISINATDSREK
jgi:hypothetical protein